MTRSATWSWTRAPFLCGYLINTFNYQHCHLHNGIVQLATRSEWSCHMLSQYSAQAEFLEECWLCQREVSNCPAQTQGLPAQEEGVNWAGLGAPRAALGHKFAGLYHEPLAVGRRNLL